jgi:hypothetical protein
VLLTSCLEQYPSAMYALPAQRCARLRVSDVVGCPDYDRVGLNSLTMGTTKRGDFARWMVSKSVTTKYLQTCSHDGRFLNAVCFVIANCLFELRYSYILHDWTFVGSPSTRLIASMATCSNVACLGGYGYNLVRSLARAIIMGEQGSKVPSVNV